MVDLLYYVDEPNHSTPLPVETSSCTLGNERVLHNMLDVLVTGVGVVGVVVVDVVRLAVVGDDVVEGAVAGCWTHRNKHCRL